MTSLHFNLADIPELQGKRVIITGASSGIGLAAARLFASKGAWVLNLDIHPPQDRNHPYDGMIEYRECDATNWAQLISAFDYASTVDIAVANAGICEEVDYFADQFDEITGFLIQPEYRVLDLNLKAVINFTKLAISHFRRNKRAGSIVINSSATAYAPEQSLPVFSAGKLALVGLVRALRSSLGPENITINCVAPAATITNLLPRHLAEPIIEAGLPVSSSDFVGLAIVYSSVASQEGAVELYGKDHDGMLESSSRWHGRTILTMGDRYTELEGPLASLRPQWFGAENTRLTRRQQAATDFRQPI